MYTFYNNSITEHLEYRKVLQKFMKRYYWSEMTKDMNQYIQVCY